MSLNQFPTTASNLSPMAQTDQNRAVAEVQAAMMIASMNPRNQRGAMDRILNACTRQSLAESAVYQFARGGANVSGASIRLAEAIAQQWGNIQFGIRELEQRSGESTVQAFAWDVETNTRREVTFHVAHELHTRKGVKKLTDPRDIYEMVANQGARRLRGCILAIIPSDVTEAAVAQCERTLVTTADVTHEAIKRLVEAFEAFGVSKEQIELRIQRRMDAVQPAQVANLRKIYASIRDGMSTADEWFEKPAVKSRSVEDLIGDNPEPTYYQPESAPPVELEFVDATPPDPYATWIVKIENCQTVGDIAALLNEMPPKVKADLKELVGNRQDEIKQA
jgi:CMP-2-keto-3-deoxyoctulosonic acid synthetase